MSVSFEGVGQVCATFWGSGVTEGHVGALRAGDDFCGAALCCREDACTVQVGGFVRVSYTGTAPAVGRTSLTADGAGGVTCPEKGGRACLVADVDSAAKTATILL